MSTSLHTKRARFARGLLMASLSSLALVGCGGGGGDSSGTDNIITTPTTPAPLGLATKALYQIALVNALDNSPVKDELTVSFAGTAKVVDAEGNVLNGKTLTTTLGQLAVGAEFSATAKEFTVQVGNRALGWSDTGTRIVGDASIDETKTLLVKLVNVKAAAQITADTTKAISSATATVQDFSAATTVASVPKNVTTADGNAVKMGVASVTIPAGTTAVDPATGAVVRPTGALTVSTTAYSPEDISALTAFPGGFGATVNPASPGPAAGVDSPTFVTGGFAQFNITDSTGKAFKQFDKPLTLSIDLPKSTVDPSGAPVRAGGTFPVWSYDDATGEWKFERDGLIQEKNPADPSNFTVVFASNHLSSWNLDFVAIGCSGRINLQRGTDTRPLRVSLSGVPGSPFAYDGYNVTDGFINVSRAPRSLLNIKVYDGTNLVGQTTAPVSICNGVTVAVNLPVITVGSIVVNVTQSCPNGSNPRGYPQFVAIERPRGVPEFLGRYAPLAGAVARTTFTNVLSGPYTLNLYSMATNAILATRSVTVPANGQATVDVNVPNVPCKPVSGA
jgi:hypothetical protein